MYILHVPSSLHQEMEDHKQTEESQSILWRLTCHAISCDSSQISHIINAIGDHYDTGTASKSTVDMTSIDTFNKTLREMACIISTWLSKHCTLDVKELSPTYKENKLEM